MHSFVGLAGFIGSRSFYHFDHSSRAAPMSGGFMRANIVVLLAAMSGIASAQPAPQPAPMAMAPPTPPGRIPASGGEVIIGDRNDGFAYSRANFAPVRRSGDLLFISGIIVA